MEIDFLKTMRKSAYLESKIYLFYFFILKKKKRGGFALVWLAK